MQRSALSRSRRELSNAYLLAKIGVDTAENEPLEVWVKYSILFNRVLNADRQTGACVRHDGHQRRPNLKKKTWRKPRVRYQSLFSVRSKRNGQEIIWNKLGREIDCEPNKVERFGSRNARSNCFSPSFPFLFLSFGCRRLKMKRKN